jgi:hypothetical protein
VGAERLTGDYSVHQKGGHHEVRTISIAGNSAFILVGRRLSGVSRGRRVDPHFAGLGGYFVLGALVYRG